MLLTAKILSIIAVSLGAISTLVGVAENDLTSVVGGMFWLGYGIFFLVLVKQLKK